MLGSLARSTALALGALSLTSATTVWAEGDARFAGEPMVTSLDIDGGGAQLVTVLKVSREVGVFEGDILVPLGVSPSSRSHSVQAQSHSVSASGTLWPDGVLPYRIDGGISNAVRDRIEQAIAHWEANTPIRLVPRTTEADYINFIDNAGCASYIGRRGGAQPIYSAASCSTGNFIHEIGHALGLYHEHTRPDRDTYVTVHWENIVSGRGHNFDIYGDDAGETNYRVNSPYDYGSIMHYGTHFFSTNGSQTITPKQSGVTIGQRSALSVEDISGINALYTNGLRVKLSMTPRRPMPSSDVRAGIVVENTSNGTLQSVQLTTTLPAGISYLSASGSGWSCSQSGQSLSCDGPDLQNGREAELDLRLRAPGSVAPLAFDFDVSARNSGGEDLDTQALRALTMTTVNDPPELEVGQSDVAVVPVGNVGNAILRVQAEDPNGHPLSDFRIASSSHPGVFEIDAENGAIFATSSDAVNALEGETAHLGITVSDGFSTSGKTTVEIEMLTSSALASQGGSTSSGGGGGGGGTWLWGLVLGLLLPLRRRLVPTP